MNRLRPQAGFSAVELLITLFIGVAFVATSYQLYSIINKGGGEARDQSKASNIAYQNLQRYAALATNPCVATSSPTPTPTIPSNSGLANAAISVNMSCPYGTTIPGVSVIVTKVLVTVTYNSGDSVSHAMYVAK